MSLDVEHYKKYETLSIVATESCKGYDIAVTYNQPPNVEDEGPEARSFMWIVRWSHLRLIP